MSSTCDRGAVVCTQSSAGDTSQTSAFNLWGIATRLVDDVKKNAESLVSTIAETDWTKELTDIQKGLQDDTQQLEHAVVHMAQREASSRAPPTSPENDFSLSTLGHSLVTGTREWFEQVKSTVDDEIQAACKDVRKSARSKVPRASPASVDKTTKYSRLASEISSMQRNSATYCDEPEDADEFAAFQDTFDMDARKPEIDAILSENPFMAELHSRIVPLIVEHEPFWQRYFYRLQKLKEQHEKHRSLVMRTNFQDETDDISWDDEPLQVGPQQQQHTLSANPPQALTSPSPQDSSTAGMAVAPPHDVSGLTDGGDAGGSHGPLRAPQAADDRPASKGAAGGQAPFDGEPAGQGTDTPGAASAMSQPSDAPARSRPGESDHTSSDWSVVSSPKQSAHTDAQPTASGTKAPDAPSQSHSSRTPVPEEMPSRKDSAVKGVSASKSNAAAGDEEIDEDWGEWD